MITSAPMPAAPDDGPAVPSSVLAEDERLLQESVRQFARAVVGPLVREMDEQAAIPTTLIDQLFSLGLMAIQAPEALGGAGGRLFHADHRA